MLNQSDNQQDNVIVYDLDDDLVDLTIKVLRGTLLKIKNLTYPTHSDSVRLTDELIKKPIILDTIMLLDINIYDRFLNDLLGSSNLLMEAYRNNSRPRNKDKFIYTRYNSDFKNLLELLQSASLLKGVK